MKLPLVAILFLFSLTIPFFLLSKKSNHLPISSLLPSPASNTTSTVYNPSLITPRDTFTILFGGDVMLGRSVNTRIAKHADYSWPFRKISTQLSDADLTVINLESPFRSGCSSTDSGMVFCANPLSVQGLVESGIDVANLANNHIGNQGEKGIQETLSVLTNAGIGTIGQESPYIKIIKGTKVALLGFNDIPPYLPEITQATEKNIKEHVAKVRPNADIVIANFHWGNEYSGHSLRQEELAKIAIDAGADVVMGHHPHWVQDIAEYKGKPIYYSLGNLVFDQMWSKETRMGLIVKLTFEGKNLVNQELLPVEIFDYGQPAMVNPKTNTVF